MYSARFLTRAEFEQMSTSSSATAATATSATMPTNCRPQIIQWRSLEVGAIFCVFDRITIPTVNRRENYVDLETKQQQIINLWITHI